MFEKFNFKLSILIENVNTINAKSISDLITNPKNVLIVSFEVKNIEKFAKRLNKFNFEEFNIHLIQPGTLEDDANTFQLLNEILSESKCKVFILQNHISDLKYFFQAADLSNFYANIQIFHNSLSELQREFSNFIEKSFRTILNLGVSGHQQHLSENAKIPKSSFDNYRLGNLLQQIEVIQKPIQYSNCVVVDLSIVKQSDLPSKLELGVSGFTSESFNQIARSIGSSENTKMTILTGFSKQNEGIDEVSVDTIAQFIYYYISGVNKSGNTHGTVQETTFIIDECLPYHNVNFTKDEISMEWFANYPYPLPEELKHLSKVPCTYNDYIYSGKGELSPRLEDIFSWLDELREQTL